MGRKSQLFIFSSLILELERIYTDTKNITNTPLKRFSRNQFPSRDACLVNNIEFAYHSAHERAASLACGARAGPDKPTGRYS